MASVSRRAPIATRRGTGVRCARPLSEHRPRRRTAQHTLPFTGLSAPEGVAVDVSGDVSVVDNDNNRVLELPAGSDSPVTPPFTGVTFR